MEFMTFSESTELQQEASRLNTKHVFPAKMYSWETLEEANFASDFQEIICPTYPDGFTDTGLRTLFFMDLPVYKPLLVEFVTSFRMNDPNMLNFNKEKLISFRLCGKYFNISLLTFAQYLGLCPTNNNRMLYLRHLQQATNQLPRDFDLETFWPTISNEVYDGSNCRESHLSNPIHRLLHRYLAWSLCFNYEAARCNQKQIHGLYHCLNRGHRWHLPLAVADLFIAAKKQPHHLPGGQFVTQIATNAGLLPRALISALGEPSYATKMPIKNMVVSYLLKKVGDRYEHYEIGEGVVDQADATTRTRMKRSRRAPGNEAGTSSQAPPPPSTQPRQYSNNEVVAHNNLVGEFVGEVANMIYNADRRAEIRHRFSFSGPYPEDYYYGWSEPTSWDVRVRMAGLNLDGEEEEE